MTPRQTYLNFGRCSVLDAADAAASFSHVVDDGVGLEWYSGMSRSIQTQGGSDERECLW